MNKKFGRNKAGGITKKNSVIMIVSIMTVTLFIGTAIQPVIATASYNVGAEEVEEECIPCKYEEESSQGDAKCKTCVGAVFYSVRYMINHTKVHFVEAFKDNKSIYFLWTVDASILISILMFEGIVMGLQDSGYKIDVDLYDLCQYINNSVDKLVDPGNYLFPVTKYLAILFAIPIGVTVYLLRLCIGN